jgi:hypothetical protein
VTAIAPAVKPGHVPMPNGKPIRAYWVQTRAWALGAGLLAAAFVAGLYYGWWEVHWTFGGLGISWDLKAWWDAGTWWPRWLGHWALYRHTAFRDQLEPGIGTLIALTIVVRNAKLWQTRIGPARLVLTPPAILAVTIALGVLGVWLNYFGLPMAWAHVASAVGHPGFTLDQYFRWAGKLSLFTLAWGVGMGFVLHRLWAPVGATLQGFAVDWLANRAHAAQRIPLYIKLPLSPPPARERFMRLYDDSDATTAVPVSDAMKWLLFIFLVFVFLVTLLGLMGHYYVGVMGHTVPYLAPGA